MFIGLINPPTIVTFLGLLLGVLSINFALQQEFSLAIICFIYAGICDLFDGLIARKVKMSDNEKLFGVQIDSMVDMACFGIVPVILAIQFGMNNQIIDIIILSFFVSSAAMRLAYFNVFGLEEHNGKAYYSGLPVTFVALLLPLVYLFSYFLDSIQMEWLLRGSYFVIAMLFILNIPIPKPKGIFYLIFPFIAIFLTFSYLLLSR
ncbi:CDP-alcohol phosphatidyltransferase family protein [Pseudoalteromonas denitrificans]|uniref:CDP-diacylglycerol---serine O-phosphatidyltransferase n=1 Tax=Pseudoalteromonas denitrificans DSM 6059 TaxID=1123010 RepID=A0A1I1QYE4_9GAMM|nr:CDP-alcohol phosphatidyltransferase family protein [Pseudoalteromonas denitrificans]SFD27012.1 CDP-diacylglycerol---serine O-phosphatidyltransferase [Pseudoalteromonas denitrificans DSM 6059]